MTACRGDRATHDARLRQGGALVGKRGLSTRRVHSQRSQDNLNTHTSAAHYKTKPFLLSKRAAFSNDWSFITPAIHGSWLNMAEIEISILVRNALTRRLESEEVLRRQVLTVGTERNAQRRGICLQFNSHYTRRELEWLYPIIGTSSDCP